MESDLHARIKELRDDLSKLQKQRGKAIMPTDLDLRREVADSQQQP